jgi:hypothetical protein
MQLAEVLELRNSCRILDRTDAEIRDSDAGLGALFDWFADATRADGAPRRERLAVWFAANLVAVRVLAIGIVIVAALAALLVSQPGPCRSRASNPGAPRPAAAALTVVSRTAVHVSSCQVTEYPAAQPEQAGKGLGR